MSKSENFMQFSNEERKILYLILHYYSNPKIACLMQCSLSTVKNKIRIIFAKAQARNRLELFKNYFSDPEKFYAAEEQTREETKLEIFEHTPNISRNTQ